MKILSDIVGSYHSRGQSERHPHPASPIPEGEGKRNGSPTFFPPLSLLWRDEGSAFLVGLVRKARGEGGLGFSTVHITPTRPPLSRGRGRGKWPHHERGGKVKAAAPRLRTPRFSPSPLVG